MIATVPALYRDPFTLGSPHEFGFRPGLSLAEMVARVQFLPPGFAATGQIRINAEMVPRESWPLVRPKATRDDRPIIVTFHAAIRAGGEDDGKSGLALVATLAITIAAVAVSGGTLAPVLGAAFLAQGTGAILGAAAISIIGGLVISALTPPPVLPSIEGPRFDREREGAASAGGNILEPNGPIPRVMGTRKIFPPLVGEPFTFYDGDDEIVEAVYALAGPHDMSDIRIDGSPIAGASDLTFEVREGWPDDAAISIVDQQSRTAPIQVELSTPTVKADDQEVLESTASTDLPVFHGAASRSEPDEILLHLPFIGGLSKDSLVTTKLRVPFRIRIRKQGDSPWRNLPEFHFEHASLRQIRTTIRLIFQAGENTTIPSVPVTGAYVEARKLSPGQTDDPATDDWAADAYFSSGSGDDYLARGTEGTTKVLNITLTEAGVNVFLDTAAFSPGIYEIEIKRGVAFKESSYVPATYFYSGSIKDFFAWRDVGGDPTIAESRENIVDAVHLVRVVSVWNEHPVQKAGFALIAIRAVNRRVEKVSVQASGYVRDWDGSNWVTWVTTSNPAPHFNDVLTGDLNLDPLPEALIDTTSLTEWRTANASLDYTCDHIAEGARVSDTLDVLAGCGFARRYQSELWGVTRDLDRGAESPIQIFSPRNSSGFKWAKAFARFPDGLRINFPHDDVDFSAAQLVVYRDDVPGPLLEQVTYQGLVTLSKARRRAAFDLDQAKLRATTYTLTAPAEAIVARRGSLIGVNHDVLQRHTGLGRIDTVQTSGGNVTGITIDTEVPVWKEGDMSTVADMSAVADMSLIGRKTNVAIRRTNGTISVHPLSNASGDTNVLTFTTPVADDTTAGGPFDPGTIQQIDVGCLAVLGIAGQELKRLLVTKVDPAPDLMATLSLVDEAPTLFPV